MIRAPEELPDEVLLPRLLVPRKLQRERVRRDRHRHDRDRHRQVPDLRVHLGRERDERVDRADDQDARLLAEHGQAHRRARRVEPRRPAGGRPECDEVKRERGEERHRPVEQHLPADEHVVRHQRQEQRRDHAAPAPVEQRADLVDEANRADPEAGREHAAEEVAASEVVAEREQRLEEQGVRPEDREERLELRVAGERRRLSGVHRLVAVVAERVQVPEPHDEGGAEAAGDAADRGGGCEASRAETRDRQASHMTQLVFDEPPLDRHARRRHSKARGRAGASSGTTGAARSGSSVRFTTAGSRVHQSIFELRSRVAGS